MNLDYKVKINNTELVALNMLQFDKNELTPKDIKSKKPIAYHQFCYDTKVNQYKSINNDNEQTIIESNCLYSSNMKYKYETGWEMCLLCRENNNKAISIWSFEFDSRLEISNLFINILFMTFEPNVIVDWYISNEVNEMLLNKYTNPNLVFDHVETKFTLLPLDLPSSPVYFDKKLDLSDYFKVMNKKNNNSNNSNTSTRFFLACIMNKNRNDKTQLFRVKSLNYYKKYGGDSKTDTNRQGIPIYDYPFSVYFTLSQKSTITNELIGDDDGDDKQEQQSNYYFIEENESIKYIRKLKSSKIHKWDNERVLQWLFDVQLYTLIMLFKELRIDGIKLLTFKIELLPISFTDNQLEKDKFIQELSKLILISGQRNELIKNNQYSLHFYLNYQHQYKQDKSTILTLKSDLLQRKQLIRNQFKKEASNETNQIKLLNDETTSNYKFIIQDRILNVHKEVLIKASEYFKTMLSVTDGASSNFKESNECVTYFEVDHSLTFTSLKNTMELIYMQSHDIQLEYLKSLDLSQLKSILILSDRFLLVDQNCKLSQLIENYIIWISDSNNIDLINQLFSFNIKISNFTNFTLQYLKK